MIEQHLCCPSLAKIAFKTSLQEILPSSDRHSGILAFSNIIFEYKSLTSLHVDQILFRYSTCQGLYITTCLMQTNDHKFWRCIESCTLVTLSHPSVFRLFKHFHCMSKVSYLNYSHDHH